MLVVHVVRQFHPSVGGLENHVRDLASGQVAAGNRVRVVTLDRLFKGSERQRLPATDNLNGIEIVRIPYVGTSRYPIALSVLRHITDADVVHVHAVDFFFDYLAWTKPIHGRKLVASTHGGFFHTSYAARLKRLWFSTVTRLSGKIFDAVIAVSASDFDLFRSIRPARLEFIEQGVNISKFHDASAREFRKSILSIGRFAQNKRLDLLVGLVQALRKLDPEWKLTIAGRPDDLLADDVRALAANTGVAEASDVVASPSEQTLIRLMQESSFLASASEYEGFGITPIEGMSAGLIPLLSDIPPFQRLVARAGCGMIVDFADLDGAAGRLLEHLPRINPHYAAQRAASMEAANAYDWRSVCRAHAELYDAIAGTEAQTILDVPIQARPLEAAVGLVDRRYDFLAEKRRSSGKH